MRDSLLDLIEDLNDEDWMVSDLYQTHWDNWNCVLRLAGHISIAYGVGRGPLEAMLAAKGNRPEKDRFRRRIKRERL